jgi:outer membrane murein-binding lipoprotein Lpp
MKKTTIALAVLAVIALSGCSSFKLGAGCYVPYGVSGQCQVVTVAPQR